MPLENITSIAGPVVPIPGDDIDTDRIIPARYMKCVTFDGLGEFAFHDARFNQDGSKKDHPLNDPRFNSATIMLVGSNFGCGSSREHAPQSLRKFGIRAIVGLSFAEIFFGNAITLGMPCVTVSPETRDHINEYIEQHPADEILINIADRRIRCGSETFELEIPESARDALVNGVWDPIAQLIEAREAVQQRAKQLHYIA